MFVQVDEVVKLRLSLTINKEITKLYSLKYGESELEIS